jgi:DNA-binding PadR family transcriptional regulator
VVSIDSEMTLIRDTFPTYIPSITIYLILLVLQGINIPILIKNRDSFAKLKKNEQNYMKFCGFLKENSLGNTKSLNIEIFKVLEHLENASYYEMLKFLRENKVPARTPNIRLGKAYLNKLVNQMYLISKRVKTTSGKKVKYFLTPKAVSFLQNNIKIKNKIAYGE